MTNIIVKNSSIHGRGVFSTCAFTKGDVIEVAPVLPVPLSDEDLIHKTFLYDYELAWDVGIAIGLGYSMLYNHSDMPNVTREYDLSNNVIKHIALRDIGCDEELTIKYACDAWW